MIACDQPCHRVVFFDRSIPQVGTTPSWIGSVDKCVMLSGIETQKPAAAQSTTRTSLFKTDCHYKKKWSSPACLPYAPRSYSQSPCLPAANRYTYTTNEPQHTNGPQTAAAEPYHLLQESTRSTSLYISLTRTMSVVGTAPSTSLVRSWS